MIRTVPKNFPSLLPSPDSYFSFSGSALVFLPLPLAPVSLGDASGTHEVSPAVSSPKLLPSPVLSPSDANLPPSQPGTVTSFGAHGIDLSPSMSRCGGRGDSEGTECLKALIHPYAEVPNNRESVVWRWPWSPTEVRRQRSHEEGKQPGSSESDSSGPDHLQLVSGVWGLAHRLSVSGPPPSPPLGDSCPSPQARGAERQWLTLRVRVALGLPSPWGEGRSCKQSVLPPFAACLLVLRVLGSVLALLGLGTRLTAVPTFSA